MRWTILCYIRASGYRIDIKFKIDQIKSNYSLIEKLFSTSSSYILVTNCMHCNLQQSKITIIIMIGGVSVFFRQEF